MDDFPHARKLIFGPKGRKSVTSGSSGRKSEISGRPRTNDFRTFFNQKHCAFPHTCQVSGKTRNFLIRKSENQFSGMREIIHFYPTNFRSAR
jgi:hypothetical protein